MGMFVNHSFDHHFSALLEKLEKKYGTEMFELEGIDRKNLDIAKFTNKFLETKVMADTSVDANANVDDTSILSWDYEMPKALMKLNGLYFLWKDAMKKHGIKRANKMIELEIAGGIRIHDLHAWLKPYSYSYDTCIYVKNAGNVSHSAVTMENFFNQWESKVVKLEDREVADLSHYNVFVLDGDGKYTRVTQCLRHKRDTKMYSIGIKCEYDNGAAIVEVVLDVTGNHPIIMADDSEVLAENIRIGDLIKGSDTVYGNIISATVISIREITGDVYDYVYDITTDSHTFFSNLITCHNCWGTSLSTIVNEGMPWVKRIKIGPIKHFYSFINNAFQLICTLSTQCAGAVAVPDLLVYAEYFIRKDFGDKWYEDEKTVAFIRQAFQHFIYSVNNSFRGNQSLTYSEKIIVDGKPVQIGEFVESYLMNGEMEKQIIDTHYTFTLNRETGRLEANKIKGVIKHKTANKIVEYVLSNGARIKATDNHSFFTRVGLEIEEIQRNSNPTNLLIPFNFIKEDTEESMLTNNITLDERWMYLLGYYLGSGNFDNDVLSIYTGSYYVNNSLAKMFPEITHKMTQDHTITFKLDKEVQDAIISTFGTGLRDKGLSRDWSCKKNILHLIGGYIDATSCTPTNKRSGFELTSVNKDLLETIQYILAGYGIFSRIYETYYGGKNNKKYVYYLAITDNDADLLNKYTKFIKAKFHDINDRTNQYIDFTGILTDLGIDINGYKNILQSPESPTFTDITKLVSILQKENIDKAKKLEKFLYALPIKIIRIDECEPEEYVYDISVENNENFLTASNIYAHNSPFTNVSVYDKFWLKSLFEQHMNPDFSTPDLDNLMRVQKLFVDELMEQQVNNPFTFPVMTAASLIDPETKEFADQAWLDWLSEVSVKNKCLNFFQDDSTSSISSCCVKGDGVIKVINKETKTVEIYKLEDFISLFNKNNEAEFQKIFENPQYQIYSYNFDTSEWELEDINGVLKKKCDSLGLIRLEIEDNKFVEVTPDHTFTVHKISTDEIITVTAGEIYNNPSDYEIGVES